MDLSEFLLARVAEDEEAARVAPPGPWSFVGEPRETSVYSEPTGVTVAHVWQRDAHHIARHDPARVLAECEAKRRTLALLDEVNEQGIPRLTIYTRELLPRLLALPYADHPDYRQEWRP